MEKIRLFTLALLVTLGGGCSSTPTPQLYDLPPVTKHPYHAGIYYSPGFRSAQHYEKYQKGGHTVEVGAASVLMLDQIFPRVFEKTSNLDSLSAEEARRKGVDLIVVPTLESFQFHRDLSRGRNTAPLDMSYRFTFWSKDGRPGPSWTIDSGFLDLDRDVTEVMERTARRVLLRLEWESAAVSQVATGMAARNLAPASQILISTSSPALLYPAGTAGTRLLPLRVRADSQDDRALRVQPLDMRLKLSSGQVLEPLSISEVVSLVERTRSIRPAKQESELMLLTTLLNLGNPVATAPTQASLADQEAASREFARDRRGIEDGLNAQAFKPNVLAKGTASEGLVYFPLPASSNEEGAILSGWVVEEKSAASAAFEVPVRGYMADRRP